MKQLNGRKITGHKSRYEILKALYITGSVGCT